jgi:LmeA-like phospholipid-binding
MRKLAIALVVVIALGVIADRGAAYVAEGVVAQKIQDAEGVSDAQVDITGFPFLTQALGGEFDAINVSMPAVDAETRGGQVRVEHLDVTFRDVRTSDGFSQATAGSVSGSGSIPYDEFDGLGKVRVGYGGTTPDGRGYLELSLGDRFTVNVVPSMLDDRTLGFTGTDGATAIGGLPEVLATFAVDQYTLEGLPSGLLIDGVEATPEGLEVIVIGSDVSLT